MNILYIIYSLSSGGAERFLTDLSNSLSEKEKCKVTILIIKPDSVENTFYKKELNRNIILKSLNVNSVGGSIFYKLYRAIKLEHPDVVHIHLSPIVIYCLLALLFYRKPIYIETLHNEVARIDNSNRIKRILKYFIYRLGLVHICAISDKNYKEFNRVYGKQCDALIYNGRKKLLPTNLYANVKEEVKSYKRDERTIVVTHIARCARQKNQNLLVDAFNVILKKYNVILLIIGNGFNSEAGDKLRNKADNGIYFLGERHNIQDYLLCSDAFCLSSIYEGMPITLIEALACQCIPLSTPVSGVVDLIKDNETGFIAKDFTLEAFIEMLERYMKQRLQIDRHALINLYQRKLSIDACAENYYHLYVSLVNKRR